MVKNKKKTIFRRMTAEESFATNEIEQGAATSSKCKGITLDDTKELDECGMGYKIAAGIRYNDEQFTYVCERYSTSLNINIRQIPRGSERLLFSMTMENSFNSPDLVTCLAVSIILRKVNCMRKRQNIRNYSTAFMDNCLAW
ncbi:mannose-1-phosphate guanylyltransferase [Striga asiatica]|uniref:Mannose-1-phosphate guanylyltransferase n=1 Tax=Striga asiatica TaxID=4170 RepID=A0A5A7Q2V7_STRAF|nr:mannose-1-phosphate guanylyltransferase [Striga asiatica]